MASVSMAMSVKDLITMLQSLGSQDVNTGFRVSQVDGKNVVQFVMSSELHGDVGTFLSALWKSTLRSTSQDTLQKK